MDRVTELHWGEWALEWAYQQTNTGCRNGLHLDGPTDRHEGQDMGGWNNTWEEYALVGRTIISSGSLIRDPRINCIEIGITCMHYTIIFTYLSLKEKKTKLMKLFVTFFF